MNTANVSIDYPFDLRWDADDLAGAVPLHLHEAYRFQADPRTGAARAGNDATRTRRQAHGYAPRALRAPLFRIGG